MNWLRRYGIGEVAGVVGFVLTILGFSATIFGVFRAKKAAEAAAQASRETRDRIARFQTTVSMTQVIAGLEEVKGWNRDRKWQALPFRYAQLRRELIGLAQQLEEREALQTGIALLSMLERRVDEAVTVGTEPADVVIMIQRLSEYQDKLQELLHRLQHH